MPFIAGERGQGEGRGSGVQGKREEWGTGNGYEVVGQSANSQNAQKQLIGVNAYR